MFCCNAKLLHAGCFPKGTSQDNIWRINNWGKGFVDYLQIYLRDLLVSSLRFCLWLRIRCEKIFKYVFLVPPPVTIHLMRLTKYLLLFCCTWSDLDLMSYTEVRATLPRWAFASLPKVWKLFSSQFCSSFQASQALTTKACPGPTNISFIMHLFNTNALTDRSK